MEIKREKYLNDLVNRMHNGMIKVITGIRRCGKSYLLFKIFKKYLLEQGVPESHMIEIELDQRKNRKYFFLIVIYKILLLIKSKNNITLFVFCYSTSKRQG